MKKRKEKILEVLVKLGDLNFQNDVWHKKKYWDEIIDFTEAINILDDYGFFDYVKNNLFDLSNKDEAERLNNYANSLVSYPEDIVFPEMLKDDNWINICNESLEIINILRRSS